LQEIIRQNASQIQENFMRKYILNAIELEISKDDESHDDQGGKLMGASQPSEPGFS